jgi:nucleotidyltransferase substrate binding protein (TIGR01987 family)
MTSFAELQKAILTLEEALQFAAQNPNPPVFQIARDACLQRFEYCLELAWKTSMRALGSTTKAAKPAIREMARADLIANPETWFDFIEARNETSHSYDEKVAKRVFLQIQQFLPEAKILFAKLASHS